MTDQVKDRPSSPSDPSRDGPVARDAGRAGDALRNGATEVRERAAGVAEHAKDQGKAALTRQKESAAGEVDSVADALQQTADRLQQDDRATVAPKIGRYVGYAARQLDSVSRQLRDKDIDTLLDDAAALGRRSPAVLFAGAAVAGFLMSRFLKSSSTRAHDADDDTPARTRSGATGDTALPSPAPRSDTSRATGATSATGATGGVGGLSSASAQPALSTAPVSDVQTDTQGGRHGQ